jgi:hypothetical protein
VRCGRCGNDNAEANRFCGMCGAPLAAKTQSGGQSASSVPGGNVAPPRPTSVPVPKPAPQPSHVALTSVNAQPGERPSALHSSSPAELRTGPVITGPSFLGLNVPTGSSGGLQRDRHDSSTRRDPLQPSSGNLDYLLEDEEEAKGGGGKLILVVVALALAAGFGYLNWKRGGFDWLNAADKKASVTKPTQDSIQTTSDSSGAPTTAAPSSSTPPLTANPTVTPIPTDGAAANPADSTATHSTSSQAASQAASQAIPAATSSDSGGASVSAPHSSVPDSDQQSDEEEASAATKAVPRKPAIAKPYAAKPSAGTKPYDSVIEAERYIYGRGVSQDCDHGLRLLKPSAEQSNPKAMISLGALYSTGTCAPRDLPTAYRWFALALHKQPDNQALQDDLQKLWSRMTQPERQLAIKLSQ